MNVNPINLARIEIPSLHATRFPFNPGNEKIMTPPPSPIGRDLAYPKSLWDINARTPKLELLMTRSSRGRGLSSPRGSSLSARGP